MLMPRTLLFSCAGLLLAGCGLAPSFRHGRIPMMTPLVVGGGSAGYGRMPNIENSLAVLKQGVSDKGDALRVLGAPKGYGAARLTPDSFPQVVWHYEYLETHGKGFKIRELMLFFNRERYDGYLWFSSSQEMQKE